MFQFHNGSIRSRLRDRAVLHRYASFNSTMVRLEECLCGELGRRNGCFNSTMVRLEAGVKETSLTPRFGFQFHNGSIRSEMEANGLDKETGFNSTMVRLEGG